MKWCPTTSENNADFSPPVETQQENPATNPLRLCLVTPCLNAGAYLEQTLSSVIDQPGFDRVDYILMDGGSSDSTPEILKRHKSRFHFFRSGPDEGLYHAVQEGFRHSDAEIMGWINADDMLCPWSLRLVLRIFDQLPDVSFITSRFPLVMDKEGVAYRADQLPGVTRADFLAGLTLPEKGQSALNFISQESTFWRRSLWEQAGGGFDHTLKLACDFELWSRFLEHAELHVVDVPMAMFRSHGANLSVARASDYMEEAKGVLARYGNAWHLSEESRRRRVRELFLQGDGFALENHGTSDAKPSHICFDESKSPHCVARDRWREGEVEVIQNMRPRSWFLKFLLGQ
jgi:glycosyltransferase involved in cell wall biosynthesis